jgi:hypothetical protein
MSEVSIEIEEEVGVYRLRVTGTEVQKIVKALESIEERLKPPTITGTEKPKGATKGLSLPEFINRLSPKTDSDKALCCGYYIQKVRGTESFTTKSLRSTYIEAKLRKSPNMSEAVGKNVRKGFMSPTGQKKEGLSSYYVTRDGEAFVESGLQEKQGITEK